MAASLGLVTFLGPGTEFATAQETAPADPFGAGLYLGAEVGGMNFDNACDPTALSCDHTDTAAAGFIGYRFDSRFTIEAGARDLGGARATYPRLTSTIDVVGDASGYDLSALLRLPFGPSWETYLRAGAFYWEAETMSPEFSATESGWSPSAGAGFGWQFKPAWQMRLQYLYLADVGGPDTGEANVETLTVGVLYTFGSRRGTRAAIAAAAPPPAPAAGAPASAAVVAAASAPVSAPPTAPAPAPPPLPVCPPPLPAWDSNVFFATNSDVPLQLASLDELVRRLRERPAAAVRVDGFADASGSSAYNLNLSRRRAQSVADHFRAAGVEESRIEVDWEGEVQSDPGAGALQSAAQSRRVRVTSPALDGDEGNCRRVTP
jgi:OOP family OmpA-OmpF porin